MLSNISFEAQLCERLHKLKRYIEFRVGGSGAEAEDVYSKAIIRILEAIKKGWIKETDGVATYFYRCAHSTIVDHFKRKNQVKRTKADNYEYHVNTFVESPEREYEASVRNNLFMERMGEELNGVTRRALALSLFQEMKHNEIAETLGIPRATVSSQLNRAREKLGDVHLNKTRIRCPYAHHA